ncbi:MAG: putative glutamate synthase [Actinomycetia bacterium]|nr:putative glutamate synthase [Actinomycetes bacterium]
MGWIVVAVLAALLVAVAGHDLVQRKHAILRNFPVVGHLRFVLEGIGPEIRQYIVTDNDEERPFSRDQRRWVYASAKRENNYFGFGTDNDLELLSSYIVVKHSAFPLDASTEGGDRVPAAKVLGAARGRAKAFRPASVVNASGMSFGSLSGAAVSAINQGAKLAGCLQNTGEGGLSPHHQQGGDLVFQLGTGYFSVRDGAGRFDLARLVDLVAANPVRALEIKLSQGAKPGLGGVLPGEKVSREIAAIRGVPVGVDCISPTRHSAFSTTDELLDFVELLAAETGLPVGIKSAVGDGDFWDELTERMATTGRGVDFVTVDGGEGGTGAAPLAFADHVALPFKVGFSRVYAAFARQGLTDDVVFVGSGKLGFPETALFAFSLGADMVSVGREAMLSIGCIQAQRCHTGRCPTGVATQSKWLTRGLDPTLKSVRFAAYVATLRHELLQLSQACGMEHPSLVGPDRIEVLDGRYGSTTVRELFGYDDGWGFPSPADQEAVKALMRAPKPQTFPATNV